MYDALYEYVLFNKKEDFIRLTNEFLELNMDRKDTIEAKRDYILNNWNERQTYQNTPYMRCSMESHISHFFADLFTSRPKAYSKDGLKQLLRLRLLKINGQNIKEQYLSQYKNKQSITNQSNELYRKRTYQDNILRKKFKLIYGKDSI